MRVAFTFDTEADSGGRWPSIGTEGWSAILDLLRDEGVPGTFFLIGEWAAQQPHLTRRTAAEGHLLGNHTLNHVALGNDPSQIAEQINWAEDVVAALVPGGTTKPWFRLPFLNGDKDAEVLAAVEREGFRHVRENADTLDWNSTKCPTAEAAAAHAIADVGGTDPVVVLMHSWPPTTAGALRILIDHFRGLGAEFVTVADISDDELQALPARG
jgi:peptidoglycan-N-acetylglucosamine deacetylase